MQNVLNSIKTGRIKAFCFTICRIQKCKKLQTLYDIEGI